MDGWICFCALLTHPSLAGEVSLRLWRPHTGRHRCCSLWLLSLYEVMFLVSCVWGGTEDDQGEKEPSDSMGVLGGSGKLYSCLASCHYCPCPAFAFSVLRKNNSLLCKHILAVHLCQAMGLTQQESVSDRQMSDVLSGLGNGT
nr:zinc finger SWIM domain-containing protein 7 isoform X2 [Paramormyrops kingsleyae]